MKIGLISDAHGDLFALKQALAVLDADPAIALILNAGDLVGRGPALDEVVELIRARAIPSVRGNHDESPARLRAENAAYLREMPLEWRGQLGGRRIYMCHGKPGNNLWGLYRDHASDTLLEMMLAGLGVDVLVSGHTHLPLCVKVRGGIVVNPGSLYTFPSSRFSSRSFAVLDLAEWRFTLHSVAASGHSESGHSVGGLNEDQPGHERAPATIDAGAP